MIVLKEFGRERLFPRLKEDSLERRKERQERVYTGVPIAKGTLTSQQILWGGGGGVREERAKAQLGFLEEDGSLLQPHLGMKAAGSHGPEGVHGDTESGTAQRQCMWTDGRGPDEKPRPRRP